MAPTAQAVARQFHLTFGCTRLQGHEYFCSKLPGIVQFAFSALAIISLVSLGFLLLPVSTQVFTLLLGVD